MRDDDIITFKTYYDPMLAHIIRTRLEDNGIPCFIADEAMNTIYPLYNNALGGVKLKIFARDEQRCLDILAQTETAIPDQPGILADDHDTSVTCPHCGSANVRYGQAAENKYGWLSFLTAVLFSLYPFINSKAWHCFNCGQDFEAPQPVISD